MKLCITGGAGNIGSVLSTVALARGHDVTAVDALWFERKAPLANAFHPNYRFIQGDVRDRDVMERALHGADFVVHACAVVGDPASKKFPHLTRSINYDAGVQLVDLARSAGIKGFFFFSTCSNYGVAQELADEETPLKPLSLYAETKVEFERYLLERDVGLDWFIGRLSTVYGSSPRTRFDLTVNDFTATAFFKKKLEIFFPESYRPYIHVYDLSNVVLDAIDSFDSVKNNVFNVGFPGENYQKIEIAETVRRYLPETAIEIVKEGGDARDYQVDFSKLSKAVPTRRVYDVDRSVREFLSILQNGVILDAWSNEFHNTTPTLPEER